MNQSEDIFALIRSLNKGEKKFFKQFSSITKGDKSYIRLFDAIDRQKKYDEKKVKQIYPDHFAVKKIYLQKQILRSLRVYHSTSSAESERNGMLQEIEVLSNKRLFDQCLILIKKAKKTATDHELFPQLFSLSKWEYRCYQRKGDQSKLDLYPTTLYKEEQHWAVQHFNLLEYRKLQAKLYSVYRNEGIVNKAEHFKELTRLLSDPLLKNHSRALSFTAKNIFFELRGTIFLQKKNYKRSIEELKKWAALFRSGKEKIRMNPQAYFALLANLSSRQIIFGAYKDAMSTVEEFETITRIGKRIPPHLLADITSIAFERKLLIAVFTCEFEKATAMNPEIEKFIKNNSGKLRKNFIEFYEYFMAYCFFAVNDHKQTQKLLNHLLHSKDTVRMDLVISAHLLNLALQYEKGNMIGLPNIIRASKRFIAANGNYRSAVVVTDFFHAVSGKKTTLQAAFVKLKNSIEGLLSDPTEKMLIENFEIVEWAESKLKRRDFAELLRKKLLLNSNT